MARVRAEKRGGATPTSVKLEVVLRLLAGETPDVVAATTGRPAKQIAVWHQRFLDGGEAYLDGRRNDDELETLRAASAEQAARTTELEAENAMLARRVALHAAAHHAAARVVHPYCTAPYGRASEEPGATVLPVPEWGTSVLVRSGLGGARQATGLRPLASLDPACDVRAGLATLREAGVASVALVTDSLWCPEVSALQDAFDSCRAFREQQLVDREARVHIRKRHRNRINQARRVGEVREIALADQLDRWLELYGQNVASRQIAQPFSAEHFGLLASMPALRTLAVVVDGEIVAITLWIVHADTLYFHDGASSAAGFAVSAAYAAFAHAIEVLADGEGCRYVLLGGSSGLRDDRQDGLSEFKRGFANYSLPNHLCGASLRRPPAAEVSQDPRGPGSHRLRTSSAPDGIRTRI